jgi:hypothetical protein
MENESNKTAIDQIFDIIEGLAEYSPENPMLQSLLAAKPRLKEIEKEQIKDAYFNGWHREFGNRDEDSQKYYNKTYGGVK